MRWRNAIAAWALVLLASSGARAGIVFTADASVPKPDIVVGNGNIEVSEYTVNQLADGYEVIALSYTVTATGTRSMEIDWITQREFKLDPAADLEVRITGDTQLTLTGGKMIFGVVGGIDDNVNGVVTFLEPADLTKPLQAPLNQRPVMWDKSGTKRGVEAGSHQLIMYTSIGWTPAAIGDKLTVSSLYRVQLRVVPEPSSLVLAISGATIVLARRHRGMRGRPGRLG